jgi:hypothetical protein
VALLLMFMLTEDPEHTGVAGVNASKSTWQGWHLLASTHIVSDLVPQAQVFCTTN